MSTCSNPACPTPDAAATLSCPTCMKLSMVPAFFCGQDCFKAAWTEHKKLHKIGEYLLQHHASSENVALENPIDIVQ